MMVSSDTNPLRILVGECWDFCVIVSTDKHCFSDFTVLPLTLFIQVSCFIFSVHGLVIVLVCLLPLFCFFFIFLLTSGSGGRICLDKRGMLHQNACNVFFLHCWSYGLKPVTQWLFCHALKFLLAFKTLISWTFILKNQFSPYFTPKLQISLYSAFQHLWETSFYILCNSTSSSACFCSQIMTCSSCW